MVQPHLEVLLELGQQLGRLLTQADGGGVGDGRDVRHLGEQLAWGETGEIWGAMGRSRGDMGRSRGYRGRCREI